MKLKYIFYALPLFIVLPSFGMCHYLYPALTNENNKDAITSPFFTRWIISTLKEQPSSFKIDLASTLVKVYKKKNKFDN